MRAIIFDWDGTLADTLHLMYAATEEVVAGFGLRLTWDDYCRLWTPDWRALYCSMGLPAEVIEEAGRRWWAAYRGRDEAELLPGAAEALERLHAAGYPLALVTAGQRDNVGAQLRRHGLGWCGRSGRPPPLIPRPTPVFRDRPAATPPPARRSS